MDELLATVEEACRSLRCGRTHLYDLLARKELRLVKLGRASRVPVADLRALVARLANGAD